MGTLPEGRRPLTAEEWKRIMEACENPPELTEYMKAAIERYKKRTKSE